MGFIPTSVSEIHPHPGPARRGVRSRGEVRMRRGNEARSGRRRRGKDEERGGWSLDGGRSSVADGAAGGGIVECEEAEFKETNRRRLRSVAERVRQEKWEMVLLT